MLWGVQFQGGNVHCEAGGKRRADKMLQMMLMSAELLASVVADMGERLPLKTSFAWCNGKLIVCVESHLEHEALQICLIILRCPLFLKFDFCQISESKRTMPLLYFYFFKTSFKMVPVSAFVSGVLFLQNRFFWYYPNETLSPFPWRQSQNCQVCTRSKILWGVFCNCQRHIFQTAHRFFQRWTFHFWWIQPVCESFYQNTQPRCVEECQRTDCWINKAHKQPSRC